ncbi:ParB/RepB/Spo0J family partition protein [Streptomyces glaucescens]|uniref:ParB/RepB/Spo0J family partition protein n=1 Tax=Streptomyces glaucescens TaxID=1907 RepID=UPI000A3AAF9B|nr:ParB/RepB/Spo0J family partition protein [Streptomyces glaucescens]
MAGKRVSLASLAQAKVEAVPGASRPDLIHVPPNAVAPTPLNPRRAFDETELAELGEDMRSGQLQPCVAVAKAAYLKLYPEHAEQLPDSCRYVMAAGERRWRAAVKVGLDSLDLMVRHDLTESRVRFLAAVLSENVQRANFNPIEEADGLRAMLELHDGNQAAAARAMGKSKGWFNQRIGLLRLTDEMVQLVFDGKLTAFREMRRYAALPPEEQYATWKADQELPPQPKPPRVAKAKLPKPPQVQDEKQPKASVTVRTPVSSPERRAVTGPEAAPHAGPEAAPHAGVVTHAPPAVPEQQTAEHPETGQPKRFPYDDGVSAAHHLIRKMPLDEFRKMLALLKKHEDQSVSA